MKGLTKAIMRTPHMMTTKVGMSKKSIDPEFDEFQRNFSTLEVETEKFLKQTKAFSEAVNALFNSGSNFAQHFSVLFHPIGTAEYDLMSKHPEAASTLQNVDAYQEALEELRTTIAPELELISTRVIAPVKEIQGVMKTIRKMITKREHKLVDYDRHNNSLMKLRDKKEKSLNDEKNLFKLEQDFEAASNEYEYINNAMKQDLPRFMTLATRFIDPLFHSFFYMQLNIYYMLLEKMNQFADGKYDVSITAAQIAEDYETKRSDALEIVEALSIIQRVVSTTKMVQQRRALSPNSAAGRSSSSTLGRSPSSTSTSTTASRSVAPSTSFSKKPPPPPPPSSSYTKGGTLAPSPAMSPPPYTPSSPAFDAPAKRAPPPPPPLKPKPQPAAQYVVALYDFSAQADGDLDFKTGDRIEVVERTASSEDWWTGLLDGRKGVFPGNYVQDA